MAKESRKRLKTYFQTGDQPTESEFVNWFDSSLILSGSNGITGSVIISGSTNDNADGSKVMLYVMGDITSSGNISASGTIYADNFQSTGGDVNGINFTDNVLITGDLTASGDIHLADNKSITWTDIGDSTNRVYIRGDEDADTIQSTVDNSNNHKTVLSTNGFSIGNITAVNTKEKLHVSGNILVSGSGHITASGNISASGKLYGTDVVGDKWKIDHDGNNLFISSSGNEYLQANNVEITSEAVQVNPPSKLTVVGDMTVKHITASNNISASGDLSITGKSFFEGHITASGHISGGLGKYVKVGTGSFGRLEGLSPITIGSPVIFTSPITMSGNISSSLSSTASFGRVESTGINTTTITATHGEFSTINTTEITSSIVTSSKIYSSGSNIFGDESTDTHTFLGSITASGDISASGDIRTDKLIFDEDKDSYIETHDTDAVRIVAGGQQMITFDHDTGDRIVTGFGKDVGIGIGNNSTPGANLHVRGNIWASGSTTHPGHITASGDISSSGNLITAQITQYGNGGLSVEGNAVFAAISSSNTIIANELNIKGAKGHITASGDISASGDLTVNNATVKEGYLTIDGSGTDHGFKLQRDSQDTYRIRHLDGGLTIQNSTDSRKEMTFNGAGNVGIGTTTPGEKLTVSGSLNIFGEAGHITASGNISSSGGHVKAKYYDAHTVGTGYRLGGSNILYYKDTYYTFGRQGANVLVSGSTINLGKPADTSTHVTASGNISSSLASTSSFGSGHFSKIGIGTTGPVRALEVNSGNDNVIAKFESTDGAAKIEFADDATSGEVSVGAIGDDFIILANSGERVRVLAGGNVGIGTDAPGEKLEVIGNISASGDLFANELTLKGASAGISIEADGGTEIVSTGTTAFNITSGGDLYLLAGSNEEIRLGSNATNDELRLNKGHITASGDVSASGAVYSTNHEAIWQGSVHVDSPDATNWYGPNVVGLYNNLWNADYGDNTAVLACPAKSGSAGIVVPYKSKLVGFRAICAPIAANVVHVGLFYEPVDSAAFDNTSGAATGMILEAVATTVTDTPGAAGNPMIIHKTDASQSLAAGDMLYPRVKGGASGAYVTFTVLIQREK